MDAGSHSPEKEIEDVKLLVESLEYQKDDSSQQQQALKVLAEILSKNKRAQDYLCSSNGMEYVLSLCKTMTSPTVVQSALYTLAMTAEGNDFCQRVLTNKSVFNVLRCNLQAKNIKAAMTSAFLVMTICTQNCNGQNLARETKCLHSLCDLYKSCLPIHRLSTSTGDESGKKWFDNLDKNCLQLWTAVVVALHSLLQNPQNAQNQRLCCRLFPAIVNLLLLVTEQHEILQPTISLLAAIVSENAECQSKVRLLGGLRALVIRLKQVVDLKEYVEQDILFMERVVNTLGSIIAGHVICQDSAADLGLVTLLLKCFAVISQATRVDDAAAKQFKTKCILALSICIDQSERNQQLLRDGGGVEALIELLTKEQVPEQQQTALSIKDLIYGVKSEEFRRVAIFILHCITGKSKGEQKPLSRVETKEVGEQCSFESTLENHFTQVVVSPTKDAQTQTSSRTTAGQYDTDIGDDRPSDEVSQENFRRHRTSTPRKRRSVKSTKVLKPFARSKTTQWRTKHPEMAMKTKPDQTFVTPGTSSPSRHLEKCEACETVLNSRNFLKTLRRCSNRCSYHRGLDRCLRRIISDLQKQK
ncbi:telomere repeats-binding bouquet formation protein 1 isoform X1 [Pocillopora verrucosa]|uniref:telomere repeats-binding bouquet formation protein 1 isoform X1 n=1 Tax=Pocillopora verrucosa TaxID=203993 RepID=UPI003342148A